jgi:hypothetical protein
MKSANRIRRLLGLGLLGLGVWFFSRGIEQNDKSVVALFLAGVTFVTGVITILASDMVRWFARPLTGFINSIYLPGGQASRPRLNLTLAVHSERHYRAQDALKPYERMAHYYPKNLVAHAGAIRVFEGMLKDYEQGHLRRTKAERLFDRDELLTAIAKTAQQLHDERPIKIAGLISEDGLTLLGTVKPISDKSCDNPSLSTS